MKKEIIGLIGYMKTIIHVNSKVIRQKGENPIKVISPMGTWYTNEFFIYKPCKIVYRPDKPLNDGAKLWIEIEDE